MRRWATIPILLLAALIFAPTVTHAQGVTSATIRGTVVDENDEPIPGANIVAVHEPSGSRYGTATNQNGSFTVANVRVGGPYTITVSFVGYQSRRETGVQLSLGETREFDFQLQEQTAEMDEVEVVAEEGAVFSEQRRGISTSISEQEVENTPTIDRSIADFARLTPQAAIGNDNDDGSTISIAGQNNRYNSVFIDGAVSNDVFGLSGTGLDGGQAGSSPISLDAIEQFNIEVSPFDVTQSYFGGGAINAVTRSGTNQFQGSFAFQYRDQNLAQDLPGAPFPDFSNERYVGRLGGPIIEDKLFFFVNFDLKRESSPQPFEGGGFDGFRGNVISGDGAQQNFNDLLGFVQQASGGQFNPGNYSVFGQATTVDSDKFFGKLDWNISQDHRLSARYNYSETTNIDAFGGDPETISLSSRNEVFPNTTQIGALELNSTFGNRFANKLIFTYKNVEDNRNTNLNQPFPTIDIDDGQGTIEIGGEPFSTVNFLKQEVFTLTNDFDIFLGDHTVTVGTHNELYDLTNKFVPFNYGWYIFPDQDDDGSGIDEFVETVCASAGGGNGVPGDFSGTEAFPCPSNPELQNTVFARGFSLVDNQIGDATRAEGAFRALNTSLYVQDEWSVSDRLTVTGGLRVDVPIYLDDPAYANPELERVPDDPQLNPRNTTMPAVDQFYDLNGARPGETPDPNLHWAPRFGFNYDAFGDQSTQIRGGTGVFTSRQPFVWPGGMYLNNGTNTGTIDFQFGDQFPFRPNPNNGLTVADISDRTPQDLIPSGRLEMFEEDYLNPRFWRSSLGVDQELPGGFIGTLEAQYTNTLKNVLVKNINLRPANERLDGPDNRPIWAPSEYGRGESEYSEAGDQRIDTRYSSIQRVGNTDRGYAYTLTARLRNTFEGVTTDNSTLSVDASYNYNDSYSVNDGLSSQVVSLWNGIEHVNGANNIGLARSDFSTGHRILGRLTYQQQFLDNIAATVSLIYEGQSGPPVSYVIDNSAQMVREQGESRSLFYVPRTASALTFSPTEVQGLEITPEQQAAAVEEFIQGNDYLSQRRGDYTERNGDRTPWESVVDLNIQVEVFQELLGRRQSVELTADIFNFSSLVGDLVGQDQWGERFFGAGAVNLTRFQEFENPDDGNYTPEYTAQIIDVADTDGDGTADEFRGAIGQNEVFNEIRTGSTYSSQWQMQLGVRYTF